MDQIKELDDVQSPASRVPNSGCEALQQEKRKCFNWSTGRYCRWPWSWINLCGVVGWSVVGECTERLMLCAFFFFIFALPVAQYPTARVWYNTVYHQAESRAGNLVLRSQSDSGPHRRSANQWAASQRDPF